MYIVVDWAGSTTDKRFTSSYCSFVGGNLVTRRSKKQNVVARSSVEAKLKVLVHGICEGMWIDRIFEELKCLQRHLYEFIVIIRLLLLTHNPVLHDRATHIEVDMNFI